MKAAKNMDSVFSDCTDKELEFELMFDDDDSLIDLVAGVNEAGELVTGANPEDNYEYKLDKDGNDPIADKCDTAQREGEVKSDGEGAKEGTTKDPDEKFESPEGMESQVAGSDNSAESKADEVTKDIEDAIKENKENADGPLKDDDEAARDGKVEESADEELCKGCGNPINECTCGVKKSLKEAILAKMMHEDDQDMEMSDPDNGATDLPEGEKEPDQDPSMPEDTEINTEDTDVESRTDDTFEKQLSDEGDKEDPISDKDDDEVRDGDEKYASNNVEAIKQKIIGAAQEAADETVDAANNTDTVPDDVQNNSAANNIPLDAETQSSDGLDPATEAVKSLKNKILEASNSKSEPIVYKGWTTNVTEATAKSASPESVADDDDIDDDDIEAIENNKDVSQLSLKVDYDDDELIDMAINGQV